MGSVRHARCLTEISSGAFSIGSTACCRPAISPRGQGRCDLNAKLGTRDGCEAFNRPGHLQAGGQADGFPHRPGRSPASVPPADRQKAVTVLPRRFQSRVLLLLVGLLVLANLGVSVAARQANRRNARAQIAQELETAGRLFHRVLQDRSQQLVDMGRVLSADFGLRAAYASGDSATVLSALDNHRNRVGADLLMVISLEGRTSVSTMAALPAGSAFPFPEVLEDAARQGQASSFRTVGGRAYQLVMVPLLAPRPIAWLCMGFLIDDRLAQDIQAVASVDVSFLRSGERDHTTVAGSTLPPALRGILAERVGIQGVGEHGRRVDLAGQEYGTLVVPFAAADRTELVAVLQRSVEVALAPARRLEVTLLGIFGGALLLSVVAGLWVSRSLSRPVLLLAQEARRIERGDYSHAVAIAGPDEIKSLATAFNKMVGAVVEREERIRHQAFHDDLTGLPNRAFLNELLEKAIRAARRQSRPLALLMMDLDRFKEINDTLGHQAGDEVLQEISARIRAAVRESDTVARLGGDEFAMLLPSVTGTADAVDTARRIRKRLESSIPVNGQPLDVGGTIGIVVYPDHGDDAHTLLRRADVAMYVAKRSGHPIAVYSSDQDYHSQERLVMASRLRQAIDRNELELHYQPKVDVASGSVTDVEALARWKHPGSDPIPPDRFIGLAEETGLIKPLTLWAVDRALLQSRRWREAGINLGMAVNLSARCLDDPELPAVVANLLARRRSPAAWLTLEITESAIMRDSARAQAVLKGLHSLGLRLSIDDFGTGHSSLAYLSKLPVSELKVDRSFITEIDLDQTNATIVQATIEMAHRLGLKVVAEGVETKEAYSILETFGADLAQGYFMARPLPASELTVWLVKCRWGLERARRRLGALPSSLSAAAP
jgi:diguanylate cyclase (GGDEF)-like protein